MEALHHSTARQLREALGEGRIGAEELVRAYRRRIEKHDGRLNTVAELDPSAPEQARKLFTLLGSGMQTGLSCCGALTAGTAILGLMTTPDGAWNSDNPVGAALVEELTNVFGQFETLWCDELRGLEIDGYEDPCYCVVETVAKKLQELLARCEEEIPHAE